MVPTMFRQGDDENEVEEAWHRHRVTTLQGGARLHAACWAGKKDLMPRAECHPQVGKKPRTQGTIFPLHICCRPFSDALRSPD